MMGWVENQLLKARKACCNIISNDLKWQVKTYQDIDPQTLASTKFANPFPHFKPQTISLRLLPRDRYICWPDKGWEEHPTCSKKNTKARKTNNPQIYHDIIMILWNMMLIINIIWDMWYANGKYRPNPYMKLLDVHVSNGTMTKCTQQPCLLDEFGSEARRPFG